MQSFTQQFDNNANYPCPGLFNKENPKYSDYITLEPSSILQPPVLNISTKSPIMERCHSSPRIVNKVGPEDDLLFASSSVRMKSVRSAGQSVGPSGTPTSFKDAIAALQANSNFDIPARPSLSNVAMAATEGSELLVKESLLPAKNGSALNPEEEQPKSPCNDASAAHASYRSGGQHSIRGIQFKKTKFKNKHSKIDRQHVMKPGYEIIGCKKQLGQAFRVVSTAGKPQLPHAKVNNLVQNIELIDLEHQLAEFQQSDRNQSYIADAAPPETHDDMYQVESKDLPKIQDESSAASNPAITQKQLVFNKKRQTWAQNVPTDNKNQTVWNVNAQEFIPAHMRQKEPCLANNFDQNGAQDLFLQENAKLQKTQQKPFDVDSPSKALEEIQEDAASLTDESHSSPEEEKSDTQHLIKEFRAYSENIKNSGLLYCCQLKDIQETLQSRELIDACRKYGAERPADQAGHMPTTAIDDPLEGHMISSEFRTKMTDWMVEVCSSFNCQPRTYFLAVTIFDKYLVACRRHGIVQQDSDVHLLGVSSIYLASKYEDVVPLHSKVVAEKIAHGAIEPKIITAKELDFLRMFEFQMDFATPFDFWQTYTDKVEKQAMHNLKHGNCGDITAERAALLLGKLSDQCLLMVKMAMQCRDFMQYSGSSLVVAALYASTAFLKHSQTYAGKQTNDFVREVRRIIFQILDEEDRQTETFLPNVHVKPDEIELLTERKDLYRRQFNTMFVEQVAMDLVDYFKAFDAWHCGLNQLKKFHQLPID